MTAVMASEYGLGGIVYNRDFMTVFNFITYTQIQINIQNSTIFSDNEGPLQYGHNRKLRLLYSKLKQHEGSRYFQHEHQRKKSIRRRSQCRRSQCHRH